MPNPGTAAALDLLQKAVAAKDTEQINAIITGLQRTDPAAAETILNEGIAAGLRRAAQR